MHQISQVVLLHDLCRDMFSGDPHIFICVHRSAQVEVGDIEGGKLGAKGGEDQVEDDFGGLERRSWH